MLGRQNTDPGHGPKGSVYPSGVQREEVNSNVRLLKARESAENVVNTSASRPSVLSRPPVNALQRVKYAFGVKAWADTLTNGLITPA
jgi:hypothetical protein